MNDDFLSKELRNTEQLNGVEKYKTALKKVQFIKEIKSGLGGEMKENPNRVHIIKKPWTEKLKLFLLRIFTKF